MKTEVLGITFIYVIVEHFILNVILIISDGTFNFRNWW